MKNTIIKWLPAVILFLGSFLYFTFLADYVGFYQEKLSLFIFSGDFFRENITKPGSLLVYAGNFLTTFFYLTLPGAIIISLLITLIAFLVSEIINPVTGKRSIFIPFITGLLIFILTTDYQYLVFNSLGVLLQLMFILLLIKYLKGYLPVLLFPFWYLLTGSFAFMAVIMYIIVLAQRSLRSEWIKIILVPVVIFLTLLILKQFILFQPVQELLTYPLSAKETGLQLWLFLFTAFTIVISPLLVKLKIDIRIFTKQKAIVREIFVQGLMLAAVAGVFILRYDKVNREYFKAQKLFFQGKYEDVTRYITRHPTSNRLTIYLNNIALCETGRLNDRLFWFPQSPDGQSLFLKWEMFEEVLRIGGYFYYETGMINEAHRWAFENMVINGIAPEDLIMLIKTEIINGNYAMAAKYNSRLKLTLFYRKEAARFEKILSSENLIDSDPELSLKRKEKITSDFFSITDNPYINIERAFASDSMNNRIFDYRMAYLMLTEEYTALISGLQKLQYLGYRKIPVHLEEAALVCRMSEPGKTINFGSLRINPQTESRFGLFLDTFRQYGNNLKTARPFLQQKFGNTFWYWAFYH